MKRTVQALVAICLATAGSSTFSGAAEGGLYSVSAKTQGLPFDMTVSEVRRTPTKSYLNVPGFNDRTAVQARWLMCVYTDVAIKRGFKYWTVVYPPEAPGHDQLVIAFSNTARDSPAQVLGADFVAERTLGGQLNPVATFLQFCQHAGFL